MAIKLINLFVDSATDEPIELVSCSCGNNVFYITFDNKKICSCCKANETEQLEANNSIQLK